MSIDAIYVYIDSYSIYIGLGIAYIEKRVFPDEPSSPKKSMTYNK